MMFAGFFFSPLRRQVVFLWYQWRRDRPDRPPHSNTDESCALHFCSIPKGNGQACSSGSSSSSSSTEKSVNGLPCGADAVEVDSLPADPHDARLPRGGLPTSGPLVLRAEHRFVTRLLDDCCNSEQRRFALAYEKWLGTVVRL